VATIPAQIYDVETTKIASDLEVILLIARFSRRETATVYMQGQRHGPYEKVQLEAMWKRGQIPAGTLYWHDGMSMLAVISDLFAGDEIMAPSLPEDAATAGTATFPASL